MQLIEQGRFGLDDPVEKYLPAFARLQVFESFDGATGAIVGSAIGKATAWGLKFDKAELIAGIYGFNAALVGIATLFFFRPGAASLT